MTVWHELFPLDREPSMDDIAAYIDNPLWDSFTAFIDETYGAQPRIEYSRCGGAPGWNVKYKARSRALCTVYPHDGFFIVHGVGGLEGERGGRGARCGWPIRTCARCTNDRPTAAMGRWLMIEVTSEAILRDAEALLLLRAAPKGARA